MLTSRTSAFSDKVLLAITVSTVMPVGLAVSTATEYVTGKPSFTGRLAIEFEARDANSKHLIGAAVDERAAGSA